MLAVFYVFYKDFISDILKFLLRYFCKQMKKKKERKNDVMVHCKKPRSQLMAQQRCVVAMLATLY